MTIKHIVISGGGEIGFSYQGILYETYKRNMWKYDDIQSVYATSIGSMLATSICLKLDFETINKYILERPYDFLNVEPHMFMNIISEKGIFDNTVIIKYLKPILNSLDLTVEITLKELYEYSNVELNIFATELNEFKPIQFSHKTYPDLKLVDAIYMSCSVPIVFKPYCFEDKYYFDGGLFANFPLSYCLEQQKCEQDEILGFKKTGSQNSSSTKIELKTIFDYVSLLLHKLIHGQNKQYTDISGNNIYIISAKPLSFNNLVNINSAEHRLKLFNNGINYVKERFDISYNDISCNDISCNDISYNHIM